MAGWRRGLGLDVKYRSNLRMFLTQRRGHLATNAHCPSWDLCSESPMFECSWSGQSPMFECSWSGQSPRHLSRCVLWTVMSLRYLAMDPAQV